VVDDYGFTSDSYQILRYFEHLAITKGQLPDCMESDSIGCVGCPFELESNCPIKNDSDIRSLLIDYRQQYIAYERKRIKQINSLKTTLRKYKLPIHWENLATLVIHRYPKLFSSPNQIRGLVYRNQDIFKVDERGTVQLFS
jgi:hypothetical protein